MTLPTIDGRKAFANCEVWYVYDIAAQIEIWGSDHDSGLLQSLWESVL